MNTKTEQEKAYADIKALIKICNDGAEGYRKAAEKVNTGDIKTLFNRIAQDRIKYSAELNDELIKTYGQEADNDTTLKGDIHRMWLDVKATFSGNTEEMIIDECKRGEKAAVELYNQVLRNDYISSNIRDIVSKQYESIQSDLKMLDILEAITE